MRAWTHTHARDYSLQCVCECLYVCTCVGVLILSRTLSCRENCHILYRKTLLVCVCVCHPDTRGGLWLQLWALCVKLTLPAAILETVWVSVSSDFFNMYFVREGASNSLRMKWNWWNRPETRMQHWSLVAGYDAKCIRLSICNGGRLLCAGSLVRHLNLSASWTERWRRAVNPKACFQDESRWINT